MAKKIRFLFGLGLICIYLNSCNENKEPISENFEDLITYQLIYKNENEYCAFCDIIYYSGKYYIAFRCAANHAPHTENDNNGYIKILSSWDGKNWKEELNIIDDEWDLRDPCFCLNTRDDVLSINYGLYRYDDKKPSIKNKRAVFSKYGDNLKIDQINLLEIGEYSHFWIWKVYYNNNKYWGVGYFDTEYPLLMSSEDGISYSPISEIRISGNETALLFNNEELLAVSRPIDTAKGMTYLSVSSSPYENWTIWKSEYIISCPEIVKSDDGRIFICGRNKYGVSLFTYNEQNHTLSNYLNLFAYGSFGERGYPGMLYRDGRLFVVYYACNDNESYPSIYMTTIKLE